MCIIGQATWRLDHGLWTMSLADAQIAGICLVRHAALATRNTKDFARIGSLTLVNSFDHEL